MEKPSDALQLLETLLMLLKLAMGVHQLSAYRMKSFGISLAVQDEPLFRKLPVIVTIGHTYPSMVRL